MWYIFFCLIFSTSAYGAANAPLTRDVAARHIAAVSEFKQSPWINLCVGYCTMIDNQEMNRLFRELGYTILRPGTGFAMTSTETVVTDKGRSVGCESKGKPNNFEMRQCIIGKSRSLKVTGIQTMENSALVDYEWTAQSLNELGNELKNRHTKLTETFYDPPGGGFSGNGQVVFRLYDDGWRLIEFCWGRAGGSGCYSQK